METLPSFDVMKVASIWMFYLCMGLGLLLHVLLKVDGWWKPEFSKMGSGIHWYDYFLQYPFRTAVSLVATILVGLLLWEYGVRSALAAAAAGYMGNSMLDGFLGARKLMSRDL